MDWRLGFFRVWVLFSVLWIAAFGVYSFLEWRHKSFTVLTVTDPDGLKFEVTVPAGTVKEDALEFVRNSDVAKKRMDDCAKEHGPWCDYPELLAAAPTGKQTSDCSR
jgi:hypothetical protein